MDGCQCSPEERRVIRTVPWQEDFCGECGMPLKEEPTP